MNSCNMVLFNMTLISPPPTLSLLAAQPNTIQHWQLRDLLSTSDVANQVYCVYGTHTLRYDTHHREVRHTRRTTRSPATCATSWAERGCGARGPSAGERLRSHTGWAVYAAVVVAPEGGTWGLWRRQAMVVQELSYPPTSMTVGHNFLASGGQQGQVSHVNRACPTRVSSPKALETFKTTNAVTPTQGFLNAHVHGLLQLDVYNLAEGKSVYSGAVGDNVNNCAHLNPHPHPPASPRRAVGIQSQGVSAKASNELVHGMVCAALHVGRSRAGEKSLLVSNNDCTIKVLNLPTLQSLASFSFPIAINYSSLSPDGDHLVCVGDSEQVYLYNARGGAPPTPPH